ncbi:WcbI family polysaccharide biosynthesis putative acetyltransferase [Pseudoalteromonas distincta]|uniref:WcbI family polysaccharide biosynthesis putative acetyltransferase n=1 Tax=Pseudoalteromonas distincta TaxID=77608 RepID=UPI00241CECCD|nr:WcbI family polysaccharide biosynthesis putative acetyltransferase [Pseudoalteromonas distincta]|tara:strand:- start:13142 stop:14020 length:879 start_codon:yes stop_codon:yes gene_type:complete
MSKKKKFTIIGNCQVDALINHLTACADFTSMYDYIRVPPIHTISIDKQQELLEQIKYLDLVIQQPVVDENRFPFLSNSVVLSAIKNDCKLIMIPSAYYTGYFPFYDSLDGVDGLIGGVHDYQVVDCFLNGFSLLETLEVIKNDRGIARQKLLNQHLLSIQSLHRREIEFNLDIKLSAFIIENFQRERLFHTFNHPSSITVSYIANQILILCGFDGTVKPAKTDVLGHIVLPVEKNISNILGLEFNSEFFIINGKKVNFEEQVSSDFNLYQGLDKTFLKSLLLNKKRFLIKVA